MTFPTSLDSFVTHSAGQTITAAHINDLNTATLALEQVALGPVIHNVKGYGAIGTADDSATWDTAYAAASDGDVLVFGRGTMTIAPKTVSKVLHLRFERGATLKLKNGSNNSLLTFSGSGADGSTVKRGTFDGNRSNQSSATNVNTESVILVNGADDVSVERLRVIDGYGSGIGTYNCTGTRILGVDVDNCDCLSAETAPRGAIHAQRSIDGLQVIGANITRPNGSGIKVVAYDGIDPTATGDAPRISGNRIDYTGSTLANNNSLGIEVFGRTPRSHIDHNTVYGPASGAYTVYGVSVAVGDYSSVTGNTVRRGLSIGLEVAGANQVAVGHNTVYGAAIGISCSTGGNTSSRVAVSGNTVEATTTCGMQVLGSCYAYSITGNQFTDCVQDGLLLNAAGHGSTISGNVFTLVNQAGYLFAIHLYQTNGVCIGPNTVLTDPSSSTAGGLVGVYMQQGSDNQVSGGVFDGRRASGSAYANYNIILEGTTRPHITGVRLLGAAVSAILNDGTTTNPTIEDCPGWNYGTAAPTGNYHYVGERVWHTAPAASGNIGWVCTAAGTPGTWKSYGTIAA